MNESQAGYFYRSYTRFYGTLATLEHNEGTHSAVTFAIGRLKMWLSMVRNNYVQHGEVYALKLFLAERKVSYK